MTIQFGRIYKRNDSNNHIVPYTVTADKFGTLHVEIIVVNDGKERWLRQDSFYAHWSLISADTHW